MPCSCRTAGGQAQASRLQPGCISARHQNRPQHDCHCQQEDQRQCWRPPGGDLGANPVGQAAVTRPPARARCRSALPTDSRGPAAEQPHLPPLGLSMSAVMSAGCRSRIAAQLTAAGAMLQARLSRGSLCRSERRDGDPTTGHQTCVRAALLAYERALAVSAVSTASRARSKTLGAPHGPARCFACSGRNQSSTLPAVCKQN